MGTIETAKESQRGVVDIETLQQTNKSLIETLDELNKIQTEGRAKRAAAEQELTRIEDELPRQDDGNSELNRNGKRRFFQAEQHPGPARL